MSDCSLPSVEQCAQIMARCHVPAHIVRHGEAAAKLGVFLAKRLREKGVDVDVELVDRACRLHDVLRMCDLSERDHAWFDEPASERAKGIWAGLRRQSEGRRHEDAACEMLKDEYPELAVTVKRHRYTAVLGGSDEPQSWEEKLVYYADKRVMHDRIVPLRERLAEAHARTAARRKAAGEDAVDIEKVDARIYELEAEIFKPTGLDPDEVDAEFIDAYQQPPGQ